MSATYYGVVIVRKRDVTKTTPVTEPLSFGRLDDTTAVFAECLLRRGELTLFGSRADAEEALQKTKALIGTPSFIDDCFFRIIECHLDARGSLPRVAGTSPVT